MLGVGCGELHDNGIGCDHPGIATLKGIEGRIMNILGRYDMLLELKCPGGTGIGNNMAVITKIKKPMLAKIICLTTVLASTNSMLPAIAERIIVTPKIVRNATAPSSQKSKWRQDIGRIF